MLNLKDALSYEPQTGVFTWLITSGTARIGSVAGSLNDNGYLRIIYKGKRYYAHRLAWWWIHNEWPEEIDHIDRNKLNNKLSNLRKTTRIGNSLNKIVQSNNKSTRVLGVQLHRRKGGSVAYRALFRRKHLGLFETLESAEQAYKIAKEAYLNDNHCYSD